MVLRTTICCAVFALAYAWALVWILERKEKKYGQGSVSFTDAFGAGAFTIIFVYFSGMVALLRWPGTALIYGLALVAALAAFGVYRETAYRKSAREERVEKEKPLDGRPSSARS